MKTKDSKVSELFDYEFEIASNKDFGRFWAIVEEFYVPESFVSNKGVFMFKIGEDEKRFVDTWLLVIPSNIEKLISFLQRDITYGDFLSAGRSFYIVKWDLQKFKFFIESEVKFEDVKDKIVHIQDQKLFPNDEEEIQEIIDLFKCHFK